MYEIVWRLRHPHEFFWEPITKWAHRTSQARIERDYWRSECLKTGCQHELDLGERSITK